MSWKSEIYRSLFVALGAMQCITNLIYLSNKNGLEFAKKQHQEIPPNVSSNQLKIKVIFMLLFGIIFLITGSYSFISRSINFYSILIPLSLFAIYATCEALYYKYWKTIGFSILTILLLLIFV